MKERPILMSKPMVRSILDESKSQTRRIIKPNPDIAGHWKEWTPDRTDQWIRMCPHGVIGDILWVKEAWRIGKPHDKRSPKQTWEHLKSRGQGVTVLYEAGGWQDVSPVERIHPTYPNDTPMPKWAGRKRSSMFMPRWASRILLEITDIRVERIQDISEEDAIAEGVESIDAERCMPDFSICPQCFGTRLYTAYSGNGGAMFDTDCTLCDTHVKRYKHLWEHINGAGSFQINPWIWVIGFRRVYD